MDWEEQLLQILKLMVSGLQTMFDSDFEIITSVDNSLAKGEVAVEDKLPPVIIEDINVIEETTPSVKDCNSVEVLEVTRIEVEENQPSCSTSEVAAPLPARSTTNPKWTPRLLKNKKKSETEKKM
ncbi:hypothetical protein FQR65_LT14034 [Abscondita terminalis]|nr:hypothetical protein FQR65_LT14034 [Abscondita terminalis]